MKTFLTLLTLSLVAFVWTVASPSWISWTLSLAAAASTLAFSVLAGFGLFSPVAPRH